MSFTGDKVVAVATQSFAEAAGGNSTNTGYVPVGATCGIAFVAPPSGKVIVHFGTASFNSGANDNKCSAAVRAGSTVGAGAVFQAAIDNNMILFNGTAATRGSSFMDVSGLTPGNTYNAQIEHKTSAGTTTVLYRSISVVPQI